jgi:hypothetical protein
MEAFVSHILNEEEIEQALLAVPSFLIDELGNTILSVIYEYGCNIHPDLWYEPMSVSTSRLDDFIADSLNRKLVVPGQCDFRIVVVNSKFDLLFCHEKDIHLKGSDHDLVSRLMSIEPYSGFNFKPDSLADSS